MPDATITGALSPGSYCRATAFLDGATEGSLWQLVVMNDKIDEVLEYKQFKLLSIEDSSPSYEGTLVRHRNDIIQLEVRKTAAAGNDMRKNLRVPVEVNSFAYPLSGSWRGRRAVETHDLSCGGVAFFCDRVLSFITTSCQRLPSVADGPWGRTWARALPTSSSSR